MQTPSNYKLSRLWRRWPAPLFGLALVACADADPPDLVSLPVQFAPLSPSSTRTDLGYEVEVEEAALALADVRFMRREEPLSLFDRALNQLIPVAHAHPGHGSGGLVSGELIGDFVGRWAPAQPESLGQGAFLADDYQAADFVLGVGTEGALQGHAVLLRGTASRDGRSEAFEALLDAPEGRRVDGIVFDAVIDAGASDAIVLELLLDDPYESDTVFDGIDFFALMGGDSTLRLDAETDGERLDAYYDLRRALVTHDHYRFSAAAQGGEL